jgi:hypothetical protein
MILLFRVQRSFGKCSLQRLDDNPPPLRKFHAPYFQHRQRGIDSVLHLVRVGHYSQVLFKPSPSFLSYSRKPLSYSAHITNATECTIARGWTVAMESGGSNQGYLKAILIISLYQRLSLRSIHLTSMSCVGLSARDEDTLLTSEIEWHRPRWRKTRYPLVNVGSTITIPILTLWSTGSLPI